VAIQNGARRAAKEDHAGAVIHARISKRAKAEIALRRGARGLSEAAYIREVMYQHLGLVPAEHDKDKT
jgi:hypothetical protein